MIKDERTGKREKGNARSRAVARFTLRFSLVAVTGAGLAGCTDAAGYDLDYFWGNIPALATLRGSVAYDPYEMPRLPAENAIPVATPIGDIPEDYPQTALDSVAATLTPPYAGAVPAAVLERGQRVYVNQCAACHGPEGAGNGPVVGPGKYPFAPAVNGAGTPRSMGYIYAIVDVGRGLMPPYGNRIPHLDRWAVAAYVQSLSGVDAARQQPGAAGVSSVPVVETPSTEFGAPAPTAVPGVPPTNVAADTAAATGRP